MLFSNNDSYSDAYANIIKLVFKALKDRPHRTALDQLVMNNYKGSSVEISDQDVLNRRFQLDYDLKGITFLQYKRILFLLDNLRSFLHKIQLLRSPKSYLIFLHKDFHSLQIPMRLTKAIGSAGKKIKNLLQPTGH